MWGLAGQSDGLSRIVAQRLEHPAQIGAGAGDRGTHVERVEHVKIVEPALDVVGNREHQCLSIEWLELAPRALERSAGGGNRAIDVFRAALGQLRDDLPGCGVDAVERAARQRLDPLAADQHSLGLPVQEGVRGSGHANFISAATISSVLVTSAPTWTWHPGQQNRRSTSGSST